MRATSLVACASEAKSEEEWVAEGESVPGNNGSHRGAGLLFWGVMSPGW